MPHPLRLNGTRLLRFWSKQPGVTATRRDLEDAKFGRTNSITPAGEERLKTAGIKVYVGDGASGKTKKSYSAARDKMMKKAGYRDRPRVGKKEIGLPKGVKGAKGWTNSEMAFLANAEAREKLFTEIIGALNGEESTTTKAKTKKTTKAKKGGSKAKSRSVAKSGMGGLDIYDKNGNFNLFKARSALVKAGMVSQAQSKKMKRDDVMNLMRERSYLSNPRRKKKKAQAVMGRVFRPSAALGGRPAGYKVKRVPKRHQTATGAFSNAKAASEIKKKAEKAGLSTTRGKFSYKQLMKLGRKGLQNRLNEVDNLLKTNPYGGSMARIGRHKKRKKKMIGKHRSIKRRMNRRNPAVGGVIKGVQDVTKKLPVVGKAISAATPAAVYAVPAFFAHKFIASQVKDFMDANEMLNQDYFGMGYLNPSHYAYTITGITAAALLQSKMIPSNLLSAQSKKGIGAALVIVGVVSDMVTDTDEGAMGALHMDMNGLQLDMNGLQLDMNGLQLDMNGYGDGGQYYLGGMHEMGGMHEYADAEMMDSYFAGHDLDHDEGMAALAGPGAWRRRFKIRRRAVKSGGRGSKHAGKKGHRWGWLIKLIGFQKFQQLAALPPQQRMQVIKSLKQKAVAHINQQLATGGAVGPAVLQETGVASENFDVLSTEGLDGWGYGAVMLAGSSY